MHLEIYAIGKLKKSPLLSLIHDYEKRIHGSMKQVGFKSFKIYEYDTKKDINSDSLKKYEAELLMHHAPNLIIALDETGDVINSQQFAKYLDDLKNMNHETCLLYTSDAADEEL
jgi:23S rRNA pseudoU1915 N3-methylase RlmH